MKGLYLYCLREKRESAPAMSAEGIDGKAEVYALPFWDLEAVVSQVTLTDFASKEIQRKAQENVNWIREKAVIHETVIEEAMGGKRCVVNLIPMKFGTIFKDAERLEETLKSGYDEIKESFERIQGCQEWSVKVYLSNPTRFEQMVNESNAIVKEKEKELKSLPEGMAFFVEEELKDIISKEVFKEVNDMTETLFETLKRRSVDSLKVKLLGKELTGRPALMILNAAYLISKENIEEFRKEGLELGQEIQSKGLLLECSGPWPAYNFTHERFSPQRG